MTKILERDGRIVDRERRETCCGNPSKRFFFPFGGSATIMTTERKESTIVFRDGNEGRLGSHERKRDIYLARGLPRSTGSSSLLDRNGNTRAHGTFSPGRFSASPFDHWISYLFPNVVFNRLQPPGKITEQVPGGTSVAQPVSRYNAFRSNTDPFCDFFVAAMNRRNQRARVREHTQSFGRAL